MQRKFTEKERDAIRNKYGSEPLFQVTEVICQFFDNRLQAFVLWPEDIFNEAASVIDNIKENGDEYIPKIQHLWKTIYPRFREYDKTIPDEQISLATSIVLDIAAITLHLSSDEVHQYMGQLLMGVISSYNKEQWESVLTDLGKASNHLSKPLRAWINDYMKLENEQYLSDEIEELFAPKPKQKKKKVEEEPFDPDFITFTKKVTNYNIMLLYQEMLKAKWIADGEPDNFFALFNGGTSEAKIVWTNKVGRDNLYALFKMMVDERFISAPNTHSVQKIVESHFVDVNGHYLTGIDGGKHSGKALALIDAWKLVLKAKAPNDD
jgi:hypothetical protein